MMSNTFHQSFCTANPQPKDRSIDLVIVGVRVWRVVLEDDDQIEVAVGSRSPFRSAETFWIEEIVDPRDTRRLLCDFAETAAPLRTTGPSHFMMRP